MRGRFVGRIKFDGSSPCDGCEFRDVCREARAACATFAGWVEEAGLGHMTDGWRERGRKPSLTIYGQVFNICPECEHEFGDEAMPELCPACLYVLRPAA